MSDPYHYISDLTAEARESDDVYTKQMDAKDALKPVVICEGVVMAHSATLIYDRKDGTYGVQFSPHHRKALATLDGRRVQLVLVPVKS